jgi:hypothetical protein
MFNSALAEPEGQMLKSTIGITVIVLSLAAYANAEQKITPKSPSKSHEGTCILNISVPEDTRGLSQFICYSSKNLVKYRCDLSGERRKCPGRKAGNQWKNLLFS